MALDQPNQRAMVFYRRLGNQDYDEYSVVDAELTAAPLGGWADVVVMRRAHD